MCLSLNNFCCCINLSAGAKIISVISTICSVAGVILFGTPAALHYPSLPQGRLIFYIVVAATALLQALFGCLLIHGTFRKKPRYTWPWIILGWLQCIALIVLTTAGLFLLNQNQNFQTNVEISRVIAVYFVYAIILYYFVSVVNSRRQQIIQEKYMYFSKRLKQFKNNYYI